MIIISYEDTIIFTLNRDYPQFPQHVENFYSLVEKKIVETVDNSFSSTNFDILFVEKLVEKLVENFFLLFSISFFHNLEYHNDDLYEQGSDKVECGHHLEQRLKGH